jgi:hypothetical protein
VRGVSLANFNPQPLALLPEKNPQPLALLPEKRWHQHHSALRAEPECEDVPYTEEDMMLTKLRFMGADDDKSDDVLAVDAASEDDEMTGVLAGKWQA